MSSTLGNAKRLKMSTDSPKKKYYPSRRKITKFKLGIGETVMISPCLGIFDGKIKHDPIKGTIVYINFKHKYFTVEFKFPYGSFRESYKFYYEGDFACQMQ